MVESIEIRKWVLWWSQKLSDVMPKLLIMGLPDLLGVGSCQFVGASDVAIVGGDTASSGE